MRVLVMGAGAVGGAYGAALAERGHAVTLVARGAHLAALRERGLTIRSGERSTVLRPVRAISDPAEASMQLDYERRRRVELDDITGAVVRLGRRLGVPTPTYEILYAVLRARAAAFGGLSQ